MESELIGGSYENNSEDGLLAGIRTGYYLNSVIRI